MACGTCGAIQDAPETGEPYIVRSCDERGPFGQTPYGRPESLEG